MRAQSSVLLSAIFENLATKISRQFIQQSADTIEREQRALADQGRRNCGIFEDVDIQVERRRVFDKLIKSRSGVALLIMLPVCTLELLLKGLSVAIIILRQEFDDLFNILDAIIVDARTFLSIREAIVLAFNILSSEKF